MFSWLYICFSPDLNRTLFDLTTNLTQPKDISIFHALDYNIYLGLIRVWRADKYIIKSQSERKGKALEFGPLICLILSHPVT